MSDVSITVVDARAGCRGCGVPMPHAQLDRQGLCPSCIPAAAGPLRDPSLRTWPLWLGVAHLLEAVGGRALAAVVALQLPAAALAFAGHPVAAWLAGIPCGIAGMGLVTALGLEASRDPGSARWGTAARTVARRLPVLLGAHACAGLVVAALSLLCVVPGVVRALSYALVTPLAMDGEHDVMGALRASRIRMRGHRGRILPAVLLMVCLLLAMGILQGIALQMTAWHHGMGVTAALHLPSVRAVRAAGQLATAVATIPTALLSVVVWAKLRAHRG